jgi:hypothetical protein
MPLSADWIEKPGQVVIIDKFFSGSAEGPDPYEFTKDLLESGASLDEIIERLAGSGPGPLGGFEKEDADHFRAHWLDDAQGQHPWSGARVGEVMRKTYLYAIEVATKHDPPLPIETFWVFIGKDEPFQMRVSEGTTQVTVFSLIPKTDEIRFGDLPPGAKPIWRSDEAATD